MTNKSISLIHFCILTCRPTYSTGYLASPLGCPVYTSNKAWLNTELLTFTPKPPLLFLWWVTSPSTHWLMTCLRINTCYCIFHIFQMLSLTHSCQYHFLNKSCINPSPPPMCSGFIFCLSITWMNHSSYCASPIPPLHCLQRSLSKLYSPVALLLTTLGKSLIFLNLISFSCRNYSPSKISSLSGISGTPQGKSYLLVNHPGPQFTLYALVVNPTVALLQTSVPVAGIFRHPEPMFHPRSKLVIVK